MLCCCCSSRPHHTSYHQCSFSLFTSTWFCDKFHVTCCCFVSLSNTLLKSLPSDELGVMIDVTAVGSTGPSGWGRSTEGISARQPIPCHCCSPHHNSSAWLCPGKTQPPALAWSTCLTTSYLWVYVWETPYLIGLYPWWKNTWTWCAWCTLNWTICHY